MYHGCQNMAAAPFLADHRRFEWNKFKTTLCKFFQCGKCLRHHLCAFACSKEELRRWRCCKEAWEQHQSRAPDQEREESEDQCAISSQEDQSEAAMGSRHPQTPLPRAKRPALLLAKPKGKGAKGHAVHSQTSTEESEEEVEEVVSASEEPLRPSMSLRTPCLHW